MQNATAKYGVNRLENQQFVFVPLFHWSSRDLCKPFGKLVRFSTLAVIPHAGFRGFALGNGSRNTALAQGTQAKVLKGASITIEGPIEKHWKGQISINKKLWICNDRFGLQTDCHCDDISISLRCLRGHPRQQLHILRQLHRVEWQSQDPKGRCHLKKPRLCHFFFFFFFSIFSLLLLFLHFFLLFLHLFLLLFFLHLFLLLLFLLLDLSLNFGRFPFFWCFLEHHPGWTFVAENRIGIHGRSMWSTPAMPHMEHWWISDPMWCPCSGPLMAPCATSWLWRYLKPSRTDLQGGHKKSKTRNTKRSLTPIGFTMMMIGSYNIP